MTFLNLAKIKHPPYCSRGGNYDSQCTTAAEETTTMNLFATRRNKPANKRPRLESPRLQNQSLFLDYKEEKYEKAGIFPLKGILESASTLALFQQE
ncbi:hypothetical protein CEXT_603361 [Caerostris extrusa]|uniref:Uncharacterized protein n=1 Tax=Caerostris extrusa TaxID=172846 RepID=A0AAV4N650_CAEEX|nr:hypothetical protein CEXT_603361 [Caerostris extrusa]